ncbi:hypothetical protein [Deinococcus sonorensis]|uniref:Uncharacterized protein n=1 Tax=Deinococcus sonorensis TaxID=309891 RepID=A0ABV8YBG6_9DEIO
MNELERYLRRATRGLRGSERDALAMELRLHVTERRRRYELLGLSAEQATRRALQDLGDAGDLNAGMLRVHTLPILWRYVVAGLLATSSLVSMTTVTAARVGVVTRDRNPVLSVFAALDADTMASELRATGVRAEVGVHRLTLNVGLSGAPVTVPVFARPKHGRLLAANFLFSQLTNAHVPYALHGWPSVTLNIAGHDLTLGGDDQRRSAYNLYAAQLLSFVYAHTSFGDRSAEFGRFTDGGSAWPSRDFPVSLPDGSVAGLVSLTDQGRVLVDVAPVKGGKVGLRVFGHAVRVVHRLKDLTSNRARGTAVLLVNLTDPAGPSALPGVSHP